MNLRTDLVEITDASLLCVSLHDIGSRDGTTFLLSMGVKQELRLCRKCGGPKVRNNQDKPVCMPCQREACRSWRSRHPEHRTEWEARNRTLRRAQRYGLTLEQFNSMVEAQAGRCAICHEGRELVIDHCHSSGAVRGLLCVSCNTAIGLLSDDVERLRSSIEYLEKRESDT